MTDPSNHWAALSSLLGVEHKPEEPQPSGPAAEPAKSEPSLPRRRRERLLPGPAGRRPIGMRWPARWALSRSRRLHRRARAARVQPPAAKPAAARPVKAVEDVKAVEVAEAFEVVSEPPRQPPSEPAEAAEQFAAMVEEVADFAPQPGESEARPGHRRRKRRRRGPRPAGRRCRAAGQGRRPGGR